MSAERICLRKIAESLEASLPALLPPEARVQVGYGGAVRGTNMRVLFVGVWVSFRPGSRKRIYSLSSLVRGISAQCYGRAAAEPMTQEAPSYDLVINGCLEGYAAALLGQGEA